MIIQCTTYQDGKRLADIDVSALPNALRNPDLFTWVALKDPEPAEVLMMLSLIHI